jgi:hypothetical protein
MTNTTTFCLFVMFLIWLVVGFLVGVNWQKHKNRVERAKLLIAEKALMEKQGQLNQANKRLVYLEEFREQVEKEFAEGRWEAV